MGINEHGKAMECLAHLETMKALERIAHLEALLAEARGLHNQAALQRDRARAAIVACRDALCALELDSSTLARGVRAALMTLKGQP